MDMYTMRQTPISSRAQPVPSKPADKSPDIASASVPDTLAALHANPDSGLTNAEVDVRRKRHSYIEMAERKGHPVLKFQPLQSVARSLH
jgi:H+-transporting ATPase